MIENKYDYPSLERVDLERGRHYIDSTGTPVPSVTTILSGTSEKKGIEQWKRRVGEKEAERVIKESTDIGSAVHEAIEEYLHGNEWDDFSETRTDLIAKSITKKFISDGLKSIDETWGLEVGLILDGLYAGTADCVGLVKGVPSIIDFKTAKKIKRRDWIDDYFLQGCAYANAHNVMFNTSIKQVVILMIDRDLIFKDFVVKGHEFDSFTNKWKQKLIAFNKHK
ncbi:preprotein translocase subunit TatA [Gammaproteobacteria bacterium]|nr:preprotein translocase subunit TatA [Gammaproteobacteria bacterium]